MVGAKLVLETLVKLYTLMRLSAGEDFIEFCLRESFKTFLKLALLRNLLPVQIK